MSTSTRNGLHQGERQAGVSRLDRQPSLLLAALAVLVPFGLLLGLVQARWEPLRAVDQGVAEALHDVVVGRPGVVAVNQVVTDLGSGVTWWVLLCATTVYLLMRGSRRLALFIAVAGVGGGLLNRAVKTAVGRERPELADPVSNAAGFIFPSGHTMGSAIGVSVLLLVFLPLLAPQWRRRAVVAGTLFAVAVGASRVVLGVHWVSDVLGAWLLSLAWMLAMVALVRPAHDRQPQPRPWGDGRDEPHIGAGSGTGPGSPDARTSGS